MDEATRQHFAEILRVTLEHVAKHHAGETKQQLDRIELDGKKAIRMLTGDERPETGVIVQLALMKEEVKRLDMKVTLVLTDRNKDQSTARTLMLQALKYLAGLVAALLGLKGLESITTKGVTHVGP